MCGWILYCVTCLLFGQTVGLLLTNSIRILVSSIKCHIIKQVLKRRGVSGGGLSEQRLVKLVAKNTTKQIIRDAIDELCGDESFISRRQSMVRLVGPKSDVRRYLRNNCPKMVGQLDAYLN